MSAKTYAFFGAQEEEGALDADKQLKEDLRPFVWLGCRQAFRHSWVGTGSRDTFVGTGKWYCQPFHAVT